MRYTIENALQCLDLMQGNPEVDLDMLDSLDAGWLARSVDVWMDKDGNELTVPEYVFCTDALVEMGFATISDEDKGRFMRLTNTGLVIQYLLEHEPRALAAMVEGCGGGA